MYVNVTDTGWKFEVSGTILINNVLNRVKICEKQEGNIYFVQVRTDTGNLIITDVLFEGRNVYPYHLLSIRHHPQVLIDKSKAYRILSNENIQYLFGATIKNGYLNSYFRKFSHKTFIY